MDFNQASEKLNELISKLPKKVSTAPKTTLPPDKGSSSHVTRLEPKKVIGMFEAQRYQELNQFNIEQALMESKELVYKQFGLSEDLITVSKYADLIAEVYHSKFALFISREIQHNKEKNWGWVK